MGGGVGDGIGVIENGLRIRVGGGDVASGGGDGDPCATRKETDHEYRVDTAHRLVESAGELRFVGDGFEIIHALGDAAVTPAWGGEGNVVDDSDAMKC